MDGGEVAAALKVGDGSCDAENPIIRACGKLEFVDDTAHHRDAVWRKAADFVHDLSVEGGVVLDVRPCIASPLYFPGGKDLLAHGFGGFAVASRGEDGLRQGRYLNM